MELVMFFIFLLTDIGMIGIFAFVYGGKVRYNEGMILGVHIPEAEQNHVEVEELKKKYKSGLGKINVWNFILGTFICFLSFWNLTYFLIFWLIWIFLYIGLGMRFIYKMHRKMYDVKMEHNWVMKENSHMVYVDTMVSALTKELPLSHWWNLPAVIITAALLLLPKVNHYFKMYPEQWILFGVIVFVLIVFWILHIIFVNRKNVVYSKESSINLSMNRMEKRVWSMIWLSTNYLSFLCGVYLIVKIIKNNWLYEIDYWVYILLQLLPVIIILYGITYIQRKRKEILLMDSEALLVDDDEYWKNGWYNNPNDNHLLVQDRLSSTNYSMNMAKPAAKVITVITAVLIAVMIGGIVALLLVLEHEEITVSIDANQVKIDTILYDTEFDTSDVQSVKIIQELPDDDFTRTNGGATEQYLIGHFSGKKTGKCMLYLYRDYTPVLEIKLKGKTIYINSKDKDEVQKWYQLLIE